MTITMGINFLVVAEKETRVMVSRIPETTPHYASTFEEAKRIYTATDIALQVYSTHLPGGLTGYSVANSLYQAGCRAPLIALVDVPEIIKWRGHFTGQTRKLLPPSISRDVLTKEIQLFLGL
jgi:hypothetical protein